MALRTWQSSRPQKRAPAWSAAVASGIVRNHVLARFLATFNSNISMRKEHSEVWIYGTGAVRDRLAQQCCSLLGALLPPGDLKSSRGIALRLHEARDCDLCPFQKGACSTDLFSSSKTWSSGNINTLPAGHLKWQLPVRNMYIVIGTVIIEIFIVLTLSIQREKIRIFSSQN